MRMSSFGPFLASLFALGLLAAPGQIERAQAEDRQDTLRVVSTFGINGLDYGNPSRTLWVMVATWNMYDRLITFDTKEVAPGMFVDDLTKPVGELAESWDVSDDKKSITFHLRKDATFHDGSPVTAEDVKWSFDRALALPNMKSQLKFGGMTDPAQFKAVDKHTFQITLEKPNRYTVIDLATPQGSIINSKLAKQHVTADDPWANAYLEKNDAGSGAFMMESFKPNEQITYKRFDNWKSGKLPGFKSVIFQTVPEASSIIALMERGRADFTTDIPLKELDRLAARDNLKTGSLPLNNVMYLVAMDSSHEITKDKRVRQAIAYALPYDAIYKAVFFGKGARLDGGAGFTPSEAKFPQKFPYNTDYGKAKKLLAEAGHPDGLDITFTFQVPHADFAEPMAVLIKESLAKAGIRVEIQKMVGPQFAEAQTARKVPFFAYRTVALLGGGAPDYWFRVFWSGSWRWNYGNFQSEEMKKLLEENADETDDAKYDAQIKKMVALAFDDITIFPIRLGSADVVMAKDLTDYTAYFIGRHDYRSIRRK